MPKEHRTQQGHAGIQPPIALQRPDPPSLHPVIACTT